MGESLECGLCDYTAKDLETLDTHLRTCEIYECVICDKKILQLVNIETNFTENHDTSKMDGPSVVVRHI
jgi:hypothetical protein